MEKGSREKEGVAGEKGNGRRPAWAQPGDRRVSRSRTLPTRPLLPFPAISRPPPSRSQSPGSLPRLNTCQLRDANCEQLTASPPSPAHLLSSPPDSAASVFSSSTRPSTHAPPGHSTRVLQPCSDDAPRSISTRRGIRPPKAPLSIYHHLTTTPHIADQCCNRSSPFPCNSLTIGPLLRSWLALRTTRVDVHERGRHSSALPLYAHLPPNTNTSAHSRDARRLRSTGLTLLRVVSSVLRCVPS